MLSNRKIRIGGGTLALILIPGFLLAAPSHPESRRGDREARVERRIESRGTHRVRARHHRESRTSHRHHRHHRHCGCVEVRRAGYYRTVVETVRVPGRYERVWVPGPSVRFGRHVSVDFCGGHYERRWIPPTVRRVERKVWVPAERVLVERCHVHRVHGRRAPVARHCP